MSILVTMVDATTTLRYRVPMGKLVTNRTAACLVDVVAGKGSPACCDHLPCIVRDQNRRGDLRGKVTDRNCIQ